MFINGKWKVNKDNIEFDSFNPANGELIETIPDCSKDDILNAIESAKNAFLSWSQTSPYDRSKFLYLAWESMKEKQNQLAEIMTLEQGKTLKSAKAEVKYASDFLLWYAEEAKRIDGNGYFPKKRTKGL